MIWSGLMVFIQGAKKIKQEQEKKNRKRKSCVKEMGNATEQDFNHAAATPTRVTGL